MAVAFCAQVDAVSRVGLKQQVVSSLRWTASARFGGQIISWAITILVIRLLSPGDYGLMAMANVVVGLLSMIAEMGFGATLIQPAQLGREQVRQLFGAGIIVNVTIIALLVVTAPAIAAFYQEPRLTAIVQVASIQFLLSAASLVPDATMRRAMRFRQLSLIEIISGTVGNASTLVLAYFGHGVWALVFGALAGGFLRTSMLHALAHEHVWPSFRFRGAHRLFGFGVNMTVMRVLWYVTLQFDTLIAGKLLGKEAVGLYYVAVHLGSLPMQRVSSIINDVAFPAFSRLQNDKPAFSTNLRLAIRLIAMIAFPMLWGLACVAPEVIRVAVGPAWVASIVPMQIIALTIPLRMVSAIISTATVSAGHIKVALISAIINTALAPVAFYWGVQYGIVGLSVAWFALVPVMYLVNCLRALPKFGMSFWDTIKEMTRPAIAALAMTATVFALRSMLTSVGDAPRLVLLVGAGVAAYLVATLLVNRTAAFEALDLFLPNRFPWLRRLRGAPEAGKPD